MVASKSQGTLPAGICNTSGWAHTIMQELWTYSCFSTVMGHWHLMLNAKYQVYSTLQKSDPDQDCCGRHLAPCDSLKVCTCDHYKDPILNNIWQTKQTDLPDLNCKEDPFVNLVPQLQPKQQPRPINAPATRVSTYIIELVANSICQGANCIIQYPQIPSLQRQSFTMLKLAENVYLLQCISGISDCRSTDRHGQMDRQTDRDVKSPDIFQKHTWDAAKWAPDVVPTPLQPPVIQSQKCISHDFHVTH
jgi:hypothetical protein